MVEGWWKTWRAFVDLQWGVSSLDGPPSVVIGYQRTLPLHITDDNKLSCMCKAVTNWLDFLSLSSCS
jgi:hypothetical protein